jgi:hypothetical protein
MSGAIENTKKRPEARKRGKKKEYVALRFMGYPKKRSCTAKTQRSQRNINRVQESKHSSEK